VIKKLDDEISLKTLFKVDDSRGSIIVMENENLPFEVKRSFVILHKNGKRGNHAHMAAKQLLVCLSGKLNIHIVGKNIDDYIELNRPDLALYAPPKTWLELKDIAENSVILVLSSERYESSDYINNFNDFISIINGMEND
jgi:hypothetical protein